MKTDVKRLAHGSQPVILAYPLPSTNLVGVIFAICVYVVISFIQHTFTNSPLVGENNIMLPSLRFGVRQTMNKKFPQIHNYKL